jgi:hypothetical protein
MRLASVIETSAGGGWRTGRTSGGAASLFSGGFAQSAWITQIVLPEIAWPKGFKNCPIMEIFCLTQINRAKGQSHPKKANRQGHAVAPRMGGRPRLGPDEAVMPDCRAMPHCRLAAAKDPEPLGSSRGVVKAAGSDAERRRDARLAMASGSRSAHFEAALTGASASRNS